MVASLALGHWHDRASASEVMLKDNAKTYSYKRVSRVFISWYVQYVFLWNVTTYIYVFIYVIIFVIHSLLL